MALDGRWLHAQLNLAWRVVVHYVRKLWPWSPRFGLLRFQQNYVTEGLAPVPPGHRKDLAARAGQCTGCGVCDDVCPILRDSTSVPAMDFMGPRAFVVAGARSSTLLGDIEAALSTLQSPVCRDCRACDAACPEVIPITSLAVALAAQHAVVAAARAGTMPLSPDAVRAGRAHVHQLLPSSAAKKEA